MYNIKDFGAVSDGITNDTKALQSAIDKCRENGGGTVFIPVGTYVIGSVVLCSNIHVVFESGAVLLGSKNPDDFCPREKLDFPLYQDPSHSYLKRSMFYAENEENISFSGFGRIDMQHVWENTPTPGATEWCMLRCAKIFAFKCCKRVNVTDLTLEHCTDIACYFLGCEDVKVRGLSVDTNIDAISPDCCKNVIISDCNIRSGDDAIVLKSSYALNKKMLCENVVITNCVVTSRTNGIKLGTESNGGYKNIAISNCTVYNTFLAGVALEITDGGDLDGVTVDNISMKNVGTPIYVILSDRRRAPEGTDVGSLKNVIINNLVATGPYDEPWLAPRATTKWEGERMWVTEVVSSSVTGHKDKKIENITLSNITISVPGGEEEEARGIIPPENEKNYPESNGFGKVLPSSGIFFRHIKNLKVHNVNIVTEKEDARDGLVYMDIDE
ncbi:MAG: hypothetical protein E7396_00580 [Ruminococcaceae bacterium]|nr:hypothetical protein [Oscillospiraceae bacterium]